MRVKFKDYIKHSLSSFSPGHYRKLTAHKRSILIKAYFVSLLSVLALMLLVAIPALFFLPGSIDERMNQFEQFDIDMNVSASQPITLTKSPLIIVDVRDEPQEKGREFILMTNDEFIHNRYVWFGQETRTWESLQSVKENSQSYSILVTVLLLLLIPSVLVVLFIGLVIESFIVLFFAWLLVGLIIRLLGVSIRLAHLFKVCVVALTPFLVFQVLLLPYVRWFVVPLVLYLILVFSATWLVGKNKFEKDA